MPEQTSTIISKVWSLCYPLRDDGVSCGDYLEQFVALQQDEAMRQSILKQAFEWKLLVTMEGLKCHIG